MALTKVSRGLLTTSIVDNGNATAITIDSSEQVGIGGAPSTQLFVKSAANAANVFAIESADAAQRLQFGVNTSNGGSYIFEQKAQALRFGTSDTERMRITSSGALEITGDGGAGQTFLNFTADSNLTKAQISGAKSGGSGGHLIFSTNDSSASLTERIRIDASGNLFVGCTGIPTGGASTGFSISDNGGKQMVTHGVSGTGNTYVNIYKNANGTVGGIRVSGSQTFFDGSSDQRLKSNIVDAPSASEDIDAIQIRSFNWKADNEHQKYGMIAQELATVAPIAVYQPEDPEEMQAVDYSKLVPMLVKEIQSLRSRVAELENN